MIWKTDTCVFAAITGCENLTGLTISVTIPVSSPGSLSLALRYTLNHIKEWTSDLATARSLKQITVDISATLRRRISAGTDLVTGPLSPLCAPGAIAGILYATRNFPASHQKIIQHVFDSVRIHEEV